MVEDDRTIRIDEIQLRLQTVKKSFDIIPNYCIMVVDSFLKP